MAKAGAFAQNRGVKALLLDLAAILWPTECVSCGAPDRDCCDACLAELRAHRPVLRRSVGVPCYSAGRYRGPLRAVLVEFKQAGRVGFARELGRRLRAPLIEALESVSPGCEPVLVTAPSRPARVRERGFRHVDLLVAHALRGGRIPHLRIRALCARRGRTAQLGLSAAARERNAGRVAVRRSAAPLLRGREVVLVDDVLTTGATVRASREALEAAGATVIAAVTLCSVERSGDCVASEVAGDSADAVEFGKAHGQVT